MKINVRSPYHINTTASNLTSALIDLYIYTGTQTTDRSVVTYSLNSTAYNNIVTFEISEFVKDYLYINFNGTYTPVNLFIDYRITQTISNTVQSPETIVQLTAFDGYGYFNEGVNPQLDVDLLQSNTIIYNYLDSTLVIPVSTENTKSVTFNLGATLKQNTDISSSVESDEQIQYVSYTGDADNIVVTDNLDNETTILIKTINECKFTPYKVTFINKFGAFQDLWFFKRSDLSITTTTEKYKSNILNNGSYNIYDHQSRLLTIQGKEKLTLNSGYVVEKMNEIFTQLLLSEKVWLSISGQVLPVLITTSSLDFKTQLNDKLINYTIEIEFAFDKINNIR